MVVAWTYELELVRRSFEGLLASSLLRVNLALIGELLVTREMSYALSKLPSIGPLDACALMIVAFTAPPIGLLLVESVAYSADRD